MNDLPTIRVGCISWTYPDWLGSFYPEGIRSTDYLPYYSKVFDIVEIDATFYRLPTSTTVRQWKEKTPPNFLFTAKLSKRITHDSRLKDVYPSLKEFEKVIEGLDYKLACVMAQMPPKLKFDKGYDLLKRFLEETNPDIRYAIEFRDPSWFRKETYDLLKERRSAMVWSITKNIENMIKPEVTSDFLYLRFMGQFGEYRKFDRVQEDKTNILTEWLANLNLAKSKARQTFVMISNHFEGFAPATAKKFQEMLLRAQN